MTSVPHPDDDPIQRLIVHYFDPAEILFGFFKTAKEKINRKSKKMTNDDMDDLHLMRIWLSLLYVVVEGLHDDSTKKTLEMRPPEFEKARSLHKILLSNSVVYMNDLRLFRNSVFHFQVSPKKQAQFFEYGLDKISWAYELHDEVKKFSSEYRICCAVCHILERQEKNI